MMVLNIYTKLIILFDSTINGKALAFSQSL